MKLKQYISLCRFRASRRMSRLFGGDRISTGIDNLMPFDSRILDDGIFGQSSSESFESFSREISSYDMNRLADAVTPFDTRLLFGLCHSVRPRRVLEIGTFIGHSTAYLAAALQSRPGDTQTANSIEGLVTTVDIMDVNGDPAAPWRRAGLKHCPADLLRELSLDQFVRFYTGTANRFFAGNDELFDLVFIDGEHSFAAALNDIGHALECVAPGGVIILHDYYGPGNLPLDGVSIRGVRQAVQYLTDRYPDLEVVPLQSADAVVKAVTGQPRTSLAVLFHKN